MSVPDSPSDDGRTVAGIPILENSSNIGVLLYVLNHDGCTKQEVYTCYKRNSMMSKRIDELVEKGFLWIESVGYRGSGTALHLTEKGGAVASRLQEISSIING